MLDAVRVLLETLAIDWEVDERGSHGPVNKERVSGSNINASPTYPGVPQAVDITLPDPSIFDSPKSLIMILESSSML